MLLSSSAAFASHRLIGWVYWDPHGVEEYANLGIPNGFGYYVTTRAGLLGEAGVDVVTAAYGSIHPDFIRASYEHLEMYATIEDAIRIRDKTVMQGLRNYVPSICDRLSDMAKDLWEAADSLPTSGRLLFASQLRHRRPDEPLLDAWLAVNCIREWRGDTHWAVQIADGLSGTEAGVLDGAWRNYDDDWLPRSRGADDAAIAHAYQRLEKRGLAKEGTVTDAGVAHRQALEDKLDQLAASAWQHLGETKTGAFVDLIESVGEELIGRIDATAGKKWMPAGRTHK
ncbi:MAG: hypothetical protein CL423_05705 [Acidimicrobiaceae bacterium]|nr:hypothetical protein [Acidimicrobiaceae bacterium]|tara:strand:+ start:471 stop:1322 length:852 start_codon:yes stop_codon:yes gene_type:complete